jgi:hypothetical protein
MNPLFSKRQMILGSAAGMCALALTTPQEASAAGPFTFPQVSGENLNGKAFSFPQDFTAQRTLVLFAYQREQADDLGSWVEGLELTKKSIPWFEMPIISTPYKIGSFIIDRGMRSGIPDEKIRDRVVTIYTDQEAFSEALGIQFEKTAAYALVVDGHGKIVDRPDLQHIPDMPAT